MATYKKAYRNNKWKTKITAADEAFRIVVYINIRDTSDDKGWTTRNCNIFQLWEQDALC